MLQPLTKYFDTFSSLTTSETETNYYYQKLNIRNVLEMYNQFKTQEVRKLRNFTKTSNLPAASLPSRNKSLEIVIENLKKSAIELSIESLILFNFVNLYKIFCGGLSRKTELTFSKIQNPWNFYFVQVLASLKVT